MEKETNIQSKIAAVIFFILIAIIIFLFFGIVFRSKAKIIKETPEYIYVKEYKIYDYDSAIYKYHQPIEYEGVVVDKRRHSGFVGVPGKGGHAVVNHYTTIKYNGKEEELSGRDYYDTFDKGDKVKVIEKFWPWYEVEYTKK